MFWLPATIILIWVVFWTGRSLHIWNDERFYYKRKVCSKKDKPVLYHAEFLTSVGWSILGAVMLYALFRSVA